MRAIKLTGQIMPNHILQVKLPKDVTIESAEVIVLVQDNKSRGNQCNFPSFLQDLKENPISNRSREEIDRYLEEERNSWDQ